MSTSSVAIFFPHKQTSTSRHCDLCLIAFSPFAFRPNADNRNAERVACAVNADGVGSPLGPKSGVLSQDLLSAWCFLCGQRQRIEVITWKAKKKKKKAGFIYLFFWYHPRGFLRSDHHEQTLGCWSFL